MPKRRWEVTQPDRFEVQPGRASLPLILGISFLIILFSAGLLILVLRFWLGPEKTLQLLWARKAEPRITVALLNSGFTDSQLRKVGGDYPLLIKQWKDLLSSMGDRVDHRLIFDADLEKGVTGFQVLILPSATAMSDREVERLTAFVQKGGGLFISWAAGNLKEDGQWRGWTVIETMAGVKVTPAFQAQSGPPLLAVLRGDSPLTAGLAPGQRLEIWPRSQALLGNGQEGDAYWARPVVGMADGREMLNGLEPVLASREGPYSPTVVRNKTGKGRVVWTGFGLDSVADSATHQQTFRQLLFNSLLWLAQRPMALVKSWPGEYQGAALFALDGEEGFDNAARAASVFETLQARGTFFLLSEQAAKRPELVRRLVEIGEVAIHADVHQPFARQPYDEQVDRLSKARGSLVRMTGQPIVGFRPPFLEYDRETLRALAKLKIAYLAAGTGQASWPSLVLFPEEQEGRITALLGPYELVVLPQPFMDDYSLFKSSGFTRDQALAAWKKDLERSFFEGGIFTLSYHTTPPWGLLANGDDLLGKMISAAREKNLWNATAFEVAMWWLMRKGLAFKVEMISAEKSSLTLTSNNSAPLKEARLLFFAPESYQDINVTVPDKFKERVSYLYIPQERKLVATFVDMQPGETRWIFVEKRT